VKYRYRSPVIFEFHTASKRAADAYPIIWLHHLEDNKEVNINIPIWKSDNGMRLTQNYITEENFKNIPDLKIEEVGRLQFQCRFKAGTDEDHEKFIVDNDSRETQETWEACHAEGVRGTIVTKELPPAVQQLHEQSLTQGRDVLSQADEGEKKKWLARDGTDWSGAFGEDPAKFIDWQGVRRTKPNENQEGVDDDDEGDDDDDDDDDDEDDLGVVDGDTDGQGDVPGGSNDHTDFDANDENRHEAPNGSTHSKNPISQYKEYQENKKGLHRKQRGLMQWKPVRNLAFAKDEAKYAMRRTMKLGSLSGRQPDVETETGT